MAEEIVALPAALDTPEGRDVVREMLAEMARLTMEREAAGLCGAAYGERSAARGNSSRSGVSPWIRDRQFSVSFSAATMVSGSPYGSGTGGWVETSGFSMR